VQISIPTVAHLLSAADGCNCDNTGMMNQPELRGYESVPGIADIAPPAPVLVSVVIPAYQSSASICQALDSVFAQTFTNFEVIVINDGSPDTAELERVLQPYFPRIQYKKQPNQGPSAARNAGIIAARGKYIALLDADDYWFPDHLAKQVQLLQSDSSLSLVYSDCLLLRNQEPVGTAFGREPQLDTVSFEALIDEHCSIATSSIVASREALLETGLFDPRFIRCEDYDLWTRLAHTGRRMAFSRDVQLCHRVFNGLSSDLDSMRQARIDVYERLASELELSARQRQLINQQITYTKAMSQVAQAKRFLVSGDYRKSRAAAQSANSVLHTFRLRILILGLRTAPRLFRALYRVYEALLSTRKAILVASLRRRYGVRHQCKSKAA
jgi:glycosyltransferase involved in cell wall biosynthesis